MLSFEVSDLSQMLVSFSEKSDFGPLELKIPQLLDVVSSPAPTPVSHTVSLPKNIFGWAEKMVVGSNIFGQGLKKKTEKLQHL